MQYDSDYQLNLRTARVTLYIMVGLLCFEGTHIFANVVATIVMRYQTRVALSIAQREASSHQTLLTSQNKYSMLLEILVLMLQPYPFLDGIHFGKQTAPSRQGMSTTSSAFTSKLTTSWYCLASCVSSWLLGSYYCEPTT